MACECRLAHQIVTLAFIYIKQLGGQIVILKRYNGIVKNIKLKIKNLLRVLKKNKAAFRWVLTDIKGMNPSICMHKIMLEDEVKPTVQHQRRLNLTMKEVIWKKSSKIIRCCYLSNF